MNPKYSGEYGAIYEITDPNKKTKGTLDAWLLHLPGPHPFLHWYMLYVIHLRDEAGLPSAEKISDEMTHQFVFSNVSSITDDSELDFSNLKMLVWLTPSNYLEQFASRNDEIAVRIVYSIAQAFCDGELLPEPQGIRGAHENMKSFLQHMRLVYKAGQEDPS